MICCSFTEALDNNLSVQRVLINLVLHNKQKLTSKAALLTASLAW